MAEQAKRVVVHGRVQGVGFRFFVRKAALRLGLKGDVRNCPDSTVEIIVEGTSDRIDRLIQEVHKGPSLARVERVDVFDVEPTGSYGTFLAEGW